MPPQAKRMGEYEQPPLDAAVAEALAEFVAKRKAEGGPPLN